MHDIKDAENFRMAKALGPIEAARYLKHRFTDYVAMRLGRKWDTDRGVDTGGRIPLNSAPIEVSGRRARSAYDIVSTPPSVFRYVADFFPHPRENFSYLDIGSGKGRTVLLASEFGFKACIGVELASFACEIARRNLEHYVSPNPRRSPCTIVNACATDCTFPDGDLVLFFNNPFSTEIWSEMARRVSGLACEDRAITVILIGSFSDTIVFAAKMLTQSGIFGKSTEGVTPRFWDSYAPFHFIVLENQPELRARI